MISTPYVPIGRVVKTHGLKGEVSVALAPGLPLSCLDGAEVWLVPPPAAARSGTVESVRSGPKGPLVTISGFGDVDAARAMCGCDLLIRRDALPADYGEAVAEEEDLLGREVVDQERGPLGTITEVIVTGANDVWVVDGPFGEVLIPVIADVVLDAVSGDGPIAVRLLEGLLPEEGEEA